jgi:hypothetical protein
MESRITFKNGKTLALPKEVANILYNRITVGCSDFQCFWDDQNSECTYIISVSEIAFMEKIN